MLKNAVTQCLSNVHLKTGRDVAEKWTQTVCIKVFKKMRDMHNFAIVAVVFKSIEQRLNSVFLLEYSLTRIYR